MGISNPGGGGFTDILKWYDQTLAAAGRFDVTGIPPGYSRIEFILPEVRTTEAAATDNWKVFYNGDDTDANYRRVRHQASDASHDVAAGDSLASGVLPGASASANYVGVISGSIYSYAGNNTKDGYFRAIERSGATDVQIWDIFQHWESTDAINQVTIQPDGYPTDEFVAGSRLQIWLYK